MLYRKCEWVDQYILIYIDVIYYYIEFKIAYAQL